MKHEQKILPWRHRAFPELARLAWPIAVSTLSYSAMTLIDTLFVGRLGAPALAGVGLAGTVIFALIGFFFGLLRGIKVLVSQEVGAGRGEAEIRVWKATGVATALVAGVLMALLGEALAPSLSALLSSPEAGEHASRYFAVRALGAPLVFLYAAIREYRYGIGDSKTAMTSALLGNVVNVVLDYLFVVPLGWGVEGVAWATVIGAGVQLLALIWLTDRSALPFREIRLRHLRELFRVGFPTGIQFQMEIGAFVALTIIIARFGDVQMAAHQVALQICHLSFLPCVALSEAASVMVGQAVGAGEDRLVRSVGHKALLLASAYTGLCTLIFLAFGPWLVGLFTEDAPVVGAAVGLLHIAAFFQIVDGAGIVARGVLRGVGDVRFPAYLGIFIAWTCIPTLTYLLGHQLGLGAAGGWLGLTAEIFLAGSIFWHRIERGGWKKEAEASRERLREAEEAGLQQSAA